MKYIKTLDRWLIFVSALKYVVMAFFAKCAYMYGSYQGKELIFSILIIFVTAESFSFCLRKIVEDIIDIKASKDSSYTEDLTNYKVEKNKKNEDIQKIIYPSEWYDRESSEKYKEQNQTVKMTIYLLVAILAILIVLFIPVY